MELTNWKLNQTVIGNNTLIAASANIRTILSINITNNAETTQVISLYVQNGGIDYYIFKDLELYSKETLIKDDKLILKPTDTLYLTSGTVSMSTLISGVIM